MKSLFMFAAAARRFAYINALDRANLNAFLSTNVRMPLMRTISSSRNILNEPGASDPSKSPNESLAAAGTQAQEQSEASRAALWNQMLNTIIVDPTDGTDSKARRFSDGYGAGLDAWHNDSRFDAGDMNSMIDQLDAEFRQRPTFGLPTPATPTTGRSVSATNSFGGGSAAMLYRSLMATLRRNNVRRELKLTERYEKPNQMRRRKRSERHRRRFADMIRKKVQLVRVVTFSTNRQVMALKARNA